MTRVTLHIDSKKKWAAVKAILEAMDITYDAQESINELSEKEKAVLHRAESDVAGGRLHKFKSHRDIMGR